MPRLLDIRAVATIDFNFFFLARFVAIHLKASLNVDRSA